MAYSTGIKRAIAVVGGIIFACLLMEVFLQLSDHVAYDSIRVDPGTGLLTYYPNSTFHFSSACFDNLVVTNNAGFHTAPVPTNPGDRPVFRIVVLGDSLMEALQVPVEDTFSSVLERQLNSDPHRRYTYEVIPVAFSGNATYQNLLYLNAYGLAYHPDLVIDVVGNGAGIVQEANSGQIGGHIQDGQVLVQAPAVPPDTLKTKLKKLSRKSKLIRNLYRVEEVVMAHFHDIGSAAPEFQYPSESVSPEGMAQEALLFTKMSQLVKESHARLLLLSFLPPADPSAKQVEAQLMASSIQLHVGYADIFSALASQETQDNLPQVFSCDGHWNEHGHAVAAGIVAKLLAREGMLSR